MNICDDSLRQCYRLPALVRRYEGAAPHGEIVCPESTHLDPFLSTEPHGEIVCPESTHLDPFLCMREI